MYYASIRVENSAGLSSVVTSHPYRHVYQLPSEGVVLDVEGVQQDESEVLSVHSTGICRGCGRNKNK